MRSGSVSPAYSTCGGELGVLESVLKRRDARGDDARLAGLPQAVEPLALVVARLRLPSLAEHLELLWGEEIGIPRDDRCLLGGALEPGAHGARLLGSLEQVVAEACFELVRRASGHAERLPPAALTLASRALTTRSAACALGAWPVTAPEEVLALERVEDDAACAPSRSPFAERRA